MRFIMYSSPRLPAARKPVVACAVFALGLAVGACSASRQTAYQDPAWAGASAPPAATQRQAAYEADPNDPIKDAPIEPARRAQPAPDDPSEPFSPNYGGVRGRPAVRVSDAQPEPHEPDQAVTPRSSTASRAYFRRVAPAATTASAD